MNHIRYGVEDIQIIPCPDISWFKLEYIRSKKIWAVNKISRWWKIIQSKRRKIRLIIARELECLPLIGIKYIEASTQFNVMIVEKI